MARELRLMAPIKRAIRRLRKLLGRRGGAPPTSEQSWDRIYLRHSAYTASGHIGKSEDANQLDFALRLDLLRDRIQRYGAPGRSRLLDAGCGNGLLTRELLELGFEITACDLSRVALEKARALVGDGPRWVQSSLDTFSSPHRFDIIVSFGTMMVLTQDALHRRAFHNLAQHLAPGGHMLFEELLLPLETMGPEPEPGTRLVRFRSIDTYLDLCSETGLSIVDHHPFVLPGSNHIRSILVFANQDESMTTGTPELDGQVEHDV
jgi:predicted TPR repeat methyltransferase